MYVQVLVCNYQVDNASQLENLVPLSEAALSREYEGKKRNTRKQKLFSHILGHL